MAKHYAAEDGLVATMMPKPFADRTGNGAHFNMSLKSLESGRNAFACKPADDPRGLGLTETGYHFIGGVLRHGRALCAAFAPTVNSYKRLVRRGAMATFSWAPVFNSYGSNNRTNSVRVPMGGGRCESRNADGAVNPYLAAALVLAAGLEGVREKIDPGDPNEDNSLRARRGGARRSAASPFLPQTLLEAVQAFRRRSAGGGDARHRACATSSSATRPTSGTSITKPSRPGRPRATATCSEAPG